MLRKDVKLGFAIGGVMLAVVVVYVLVVPNNERKGAQLVVDETQTSATPTPQKPDQPTAEVKPAETKTADAKSTDSPEVKPDNVGEPKASVAISNSTDQPTTAPSVAKGDVWDVALRDGVIPPSMSATPTNASDATAQPDQSTAQKPSDAASEKSADKAGDKTSLLTNQPDAAVADPGAPDASADAKLAGETQPKVAATTSEQTHVVKSGETLSSIAAATYGDAKSWKLIAAANPSINPNRLSAGTQLTIPAATGHAAKAASASGSTSIDSKTQYQVQPNDSLYRISVKLYGKADHFDKLFQDNKDLIGDDPRRLKVGMILKLTDPPVNVAPAS